MERCNDRIDIRDCSASFGIEYAEEPVYCQAVIRKIGYAVEFGGEYVATIAMTGQCAWMQTDGRILPDALIGLIGRKVEAKFR